MTTHLGQQGLAMCGASFLLAYAVTPDVEVCDCRPCLCVAAAQMAAAQSAIATRLHALCADKEVVRGAAKE